MTIAKTKFSPKVLGSNEDGKNTLPLMHSTL